MEIHRNILPIIEQSLDEYSVTLITGARQAGNTTLAPNVFAYPIRLYSLQRRRNRKTMSQKNGQRMANGQNKHMFRKGKGRLADTPANRNAMASVAPDEHNYVETDKHDNRWYAKTVDGKQLWVKVRNGMVTDCSMNDEPRNIKDLFDRKDTNRK